MRHVSAMSYVMAMATNGLPTAANGLPMAANGLPMAANGLPMAANGCHWQPDSVRSCDFKKYI